jgi:hypothetical protein
LEKKGEKGVIKMKFLSFDDFVKNCFAFTSCKISLRIHVQDVNGNVIKTPLPEFDGVKVVGNVGRYFWDKVPELKVFADSNSSISLLRVFGNSKTVRLRVPLLFNNQICWMHDFGKIIDGCPVVGLEVFEMQGLGLGDVLEQQSITNFVGIFHWDYKYKSEKNKKLVEKTWPKGGRPRRVILESRPVKDK